MERNSSPNSRSLDPTTHTLYHAPTHPTTQSEKDYSTCSQFSIKQLQKFELSVTILGEILLGAETKCEHYSSSSLYKRGQSSGVSESSVAFAL